MHATYIADRDGTPLLLAPLKNRLPRLQHVWVDSGYAGRAVGWIESTLGWTAEVVKQGGPATKASGPLGAEPPTIPADFHVLPRRWVVERTFA